MDFSGYEERDRGLMGIAEAVLHVVLALVVLGGVYTFFFKTELGIPSTDIKSIELGILHTDGMSLEDEDYGGPHRQDNFFIEFKMVPFLMQLHGAAPILPLKTILSY